MHRINISGGFIWLYEDEYNNNPSILDEHINNITVLQKVLQYDFNAELINVFENASDAKRKLGYSVVGCCCHLSKSSHGYIFKYENDKLEITKEYANYVKNLLHNISNKPFYQVDKDMRIVNEYNCLREAVEDGFNERMVNECLRDLRCSYKGFVWIYKNKFNSLTKDICIDKINANNRKNIKSYKVLQYDMNHILIKEYQCAEHVKYDGYSPTLVADCCKGLKPQYKGFIWEYGEERNKIVA